MGKKVGSDRKRPRCVGQKNNQICVPSPAGPVWCDQNGRNAFRLDALQYTREERKGGEEIEKLESFPRSDQGVRCKSLWVASSGHIHRKLVVET